MQVSREGERYHGSLTRVSDQVRLPFSGVLELLAALERLTSTRAGGDPEHGTKRLDSR